MCKIATKICTKRNLFCALFAEQVRWAMCPMMDDVLSTLTQSITNAQHSLRHRDVTDDAMTLKRPSVTSDDLQLTTKSSSVNGRHK